MTPLEELLAHGRLGEQGARLLYRVVRAVVVARGYPPPGGRPRWDADAVVETAHDFLSDGRTARRLTYLALHALDDDGLARLLHRMVLNYLRDVARRTELGRLVLRLKEVLGRSDSFVAEAGDRWRLPSQPAVPSSADPAALEDAASAEPHVDVPRWSRQTRRLPPAADAPSLERLCRRVLAAAGGTVASDDLARAIAPRLGLNLMPLVHPVDDRDALERAPGPQSADTVIDSMRAAEIFAVLSERERLLLGAAGTPLRELRQVIGVGASQASELQARLRSVIATELRDDDNYESVFFHLVDQAKVWAAERTNVRSGTSG